MDVTHTSHEFKMFPIFNMYESFHRDKFNKFLLDTRQNYEQFKNFFAMDSLEDESSGPDRSGRDQTGWVPARPVWSGPTRFRV